MSIEDLDESDLALVDLIAGKVAERLQKSLLHLPAFAAEDLKPYAGAQNMASLPARDRVRDYQLRMRILTDGGIELQLLTIGNQIVWKGILSP